VVAVGLTVTVPFAEVEAKFPGVTATLVAPEAAQLSAVLFPATIAAGLAEKVVIDGGGACEMVGNGEVQPASTAQATRLANKFRRDSREYCLNRLRR
jgi:hypothetical protein